MDPYTEGDKIFRNIAHEFEVEEIDDINKVNDFFTRLLIETKGAVIIDFLDGGNWDRFCGHEIDKENGLLYLYWYGCEENNSGGTDIRASSMPLHGLLLRFQSLLIFNEPSKNPLFLLQGYTMTDKEIRKALGQGEDIYYKFKFNYFSEMIRDVNQKFLCLNTPMYSALILPKSVGTSADWSSYFLYNFNLILCENKLEEIKNILIPINPKNHDLIREKSSTIRRTLENVLKIESCFMDIEYKKPYSHQLLGDLIGNLKSKHDRSVKSPFGKMAEWANELSHDSGLPVEKAKAQELCNLVLDYAKQVRKAIDERFSEH